MMIGNKLETSTYRKGNTKTCYIRKRNRLPILMLHQS